MSDISAARHLAISAEAYRLLARLDGVRTPAEAAQGLGIDGADVTALLRRLLAAGLLKPVCAGVAAPGPPPPRPKGPVEGRYLFMRRELFELMPVLPAIDRLFGWLFRPVGVVLWAVLGATALLRLASGLEGNDLFSWALQFSPGEALALFAVFFVLKLVHELGHALALRRMAAAEGLPLNSVRAGVALMLLAPFPFTNASAAWGLASKWRRAAVGAAGMYVESWAAILAILLWSITDDPVLRSACLQVATVAGVTTLLFNLNPLGRMDDYYILGDLLERPKLAQRGHAAAMATAARLFGIRPAADLPPLESDMLAYWAGMLTYRLLIFAGMVWLAQKLAPAAALVMLVIAAAGAPGAGNSALVDCRSHRASAAFLALVPLPAGIAADGIVEATGARFVFPPRDVRVVAVSASGAGDATLLRLDAPDLLGERAVAAARHSDALERWRRTMDSPDGGSAQAAAETANGQTAALARIDGEIARLTVAATPGWDSLDAGDYAGSWVTPDRTRPLAVAIAPGAMRLHALVSEADAETLRRGAGTATARAAGRPDLALRAAITRIDDEARDTLPAAALGRPAGGQHRRRPDRSRRSPR